MLKQTSNRSTYTIDFDYSGEQQMIVNGVRIGVELVYDGHINYIVSEREDRISDIRLFMAGALRDYTRDRSYDISLMQEDLDTLLASKEEYVLEAYQTNGFIASDLEPERFQDTCNEILESAAMFYKERVGELTKTGKLYKKALSYYDGGTLEVYANELVLIQEDNLCDSRLPVGMEVRKFNKRVPDGYVAAYIGPSGEYVPVYLE